MARRTQIIDALVDHLAQNTDALPSNVTKRYAYLDEVNDFPAITLISRSESREQRGAGRKLALIEISVRGYIYDGSDAMGVAEQFAFRIESAIETFQDNFASLAVEEARVAEVRTDEGVFQPYGIVDMQIQILYDVEITT